MQRRKFQTKSSVWDFISDSYFHSSHHVVCAAGRLGLKFSALHVTFQRWPVNKKLESLLLEKFSRVEFEKDLMGGAVMVAAYK